MRNRIQDLNVVLTSQEYPKILMIMLLKENCYGMEIAKITHKKQSNISERLKILEKHGIIKKSFRDKAQHFSIDRNKLFNISYSIMWHSKPMCSQYSFFQCLKYVMTIPNNSDKPLLAYLYEAYIESIEVNNNDSG